VLLQLRPVGPERVGLEHVHADVHVAAVDVLDHRRRGQVQLVEAAVEIDAHRVQARAHRPSNTTTRDDSSSRKSLAWKAPGEI